MAEILGDCCAALCAVFCICCTESMQQWCFFTKCCMGSNSSGQAGCFGRCCRRQFDDDEFMNDIEREHREAAANFKPDEHSSSDANAMHEMPGQSRAGYIDAQPPAVRSMDDGRPSLSNGRPSMNGTRPSQ